MSRPWIRLYTDLVHDRHCQTLKPKDFRERFLAAAQGTLNEFSRFVRSDNGRPGRSEWAVIRRRIFERDDYTCRYCSARGVRLECDHIIPVSFGGRTEDTNLATACKKCNRSERDKELSAWLKEAHQ